MALHRLSTPPRAALHSSSSRTGSKSRRAWLRDTTVWLALGLSIATTMVVLARSTANPPPASMSPTTTLAARGLSHTSHAVTPASNGHLRPIVRPRSTAVVTKATTPARGATAPTTPTTIAHPTHTAALAAIMPAITVVSEQWAGTLTYPDDVATSYSFTTTGGTVIVRTTLASGATRLSSSLQCGDAPELRTSHTAETTMNAPAGSCTYNLQFVEASFASGAQANYLITAQYPAAAPTS
jgi:hypothetical protein